MSSSKKPGKRSKYLMKDSSVCVVVVNVQRRDVFANLFRDIVTQLSVVGFYCQQDQATHYPNSKGQIEQKRSAQLHTVRLTPSHETVTLNWEVKMVEKKQ